MLNWLGREGLRFIQTLNDKEQEKHRAGIELFRVLSDKFKP